MTATFVGLAGLPRSGSTLLQAILGENPLIHAESTSALCQLMWDLQVSCQVAAYEQLNGNPRRNVQDQIIRGLADNYYAHATRPIIVDKCRTWHLPENLKMMARYLNDAPKVLVMHRRLEHVVASLLAIWTQNGRDPGVEEQLRNDPTNFIVQSADGIMAAQNSRDARCHFVDYDTFISSPNTTLDGIYKFCGWSRFDHDLTQITNQHPEDDFRHGLIGLHDVRSTISRREITYRLQDETIEWCRRIDAELALYA